MWFFLLSDCVRRVGWECHGSETRERNVWSAGSKKDTCASQTTNVIFVVFLYLCICALVFVFVFDGKLQRIMSAGSEKDTCASQTPNWHQVSGGEEEYWVSQGQVGGHQTPDWPQITEAHLQRLLRGCNWLRDQYSCVVEVLGNHCQRIWMHFCGGQHRSKSLCCKCSTCYLERKVGKGSV